MKGSEYTPREGEFDPLANGGASDDAQGAIKEKPATQHHVLKVLSLDDVLNYVPPPGACLVGDGIVELGETTLLYGPPGSFKGFAVGQLMVQLAMGQGEWLGHPIQAQCASLWINCENGRRRLRDQFQKMNPPAAAREFLYVTDIPAVWNLNDPNLVRDIRNCIIEKKIRLVIIDTVSNFVSDEFAKEFAGFFASLNLITHGIEPKPAVLLIHHSRKPKDTDKGGRGLLNLISGHQMLQRRARSICYLGRVTEEFNKKRLASVWLKVSNNGEAEGTKTALQLGEDGMLHPIQDFDWSVWHGGSSTGVAKREPKVNEEHVRETFEHGRSKMVVKQAVERLQEIAGVGRSAAYEALKINGRFAGMLAYDENKLLGLRSDEPEASTKG